jgi:hypothetical protein
MASPPLTFRPVERFIRPAPVPHIVTEKELPTGHRVLVFLPHSDDGRFFGGTLHLLNRSNRVKVVVMSPGFHGVDQDLSVEEKIRLRWEEALAWGAALGFDAGRITAFRADRTYTSQKVDPADQERLDGLVASEAPTLVFLPHLGDTAQAINYNTRAMVVSSLLRWIGGRDGRGPGPGPLPPLFVAEYPTNHMPILPPSDKNFVIFFTDPEITRLRREANLEHRSQSPSCFDLTEKLVEAVHAISEADTLHYLQRRRHYAECLSGVTVDPRTSRGEHFGLTTLEVRGVPPAVVEDRVSFPLSERLSHFWNREEKSAG